MTDLEQAQLDAFDEVVAQLPPDKGWLTCNGKRVRVIPSQVRNSRLLQEAGYLSNELSMIEIKRTDFEALSITHKSTVDLDTKTKMRPLDINDDETDPILNITLTTRH